MSHFNMTEKEVEKRAVAAVEHIAKGMEDSKLYQNRKCKELNMQEIFHHLFNTTSSNKVKRHILVCSDCNTLIKIYDSIIDQAIKKKKK